MYYIYALSDTHYVHSTQLKRCVVGVVNASDFTRPEPRDRRHSLAILRKARVVVVVVVLVVARANIACRALENGFPAVIAYNIISRRVYNKDV